MKVTDSSCRDFNIIPVQYDSVARVALLDSSDAAAVEDTGKYCSPGAGDVLLLDEWTWLEVESSIRLVQATRTCYLRLEVSNATLPTS